MLQSVIKPGMAVPLGIGARRDGFSVAARHAQQQGHRLFAMVMAVSGRIRSMLLEAEEPCPRIEFAYFQNARMSREMYRL